MTKKTKEEPTALTTAMTIAEDIREVVEGIIANHGECSDELLARLRGLNMALEVKAENIGFVKARIESECEYFKVIEEAAKAQRKSREAALERMKNYLAVCMKEANIKSIKKTDGLFTFSLVEGRIKTVIENKEWIPYEFTEIVEVITPKTDEIKKALMSGQTIPGACLERGEDYVMIRGGK